MILQGSRSGCVQRETPGASQGNRGVTGTARNMLLVKRRTRRVTQISCNRWGGSGDDSWDMQKKQHALMQTKGA